MLASEDPLGYVFHVLSYVAVANLNASNVEKTKCLIDGLPRALKAYFVRDMPQTVHAFIERPKSVAVEHAYEQSTAIEAFGPASLARLTNARNTIASALQHFGIYFKRLQELLSHLLKPV